ncbi:MAG TPA: nitrilase-related carbon-nitrogen hydrolase, partial [Microthrixaceae bacterium]|nr:nitrilase-related carbon-nitrogen hydrolase [Microthrixaceae bacterium]
MSSVRVALAQLNPTVGDLVSNTDAILEALSESEAGGARITVFGELAVCGYPPEDLVLKRRFVDDCWTQVERIAEASGSCAAVVGVPQRAEDGRLYNAAVVCRDGRVDYVYRKQELPTYAVFDEHRWFRPGDVDQPLWDFDGVPVGISVC